MLPSRITKWQALAGVILVLMLSPKLGDWAARQVAEAPTYIRNAVHHLIQMAPPLFIMLAWPGRKPADWGFRRGDSRKGWKWVWSFSLIWIGLYAAITLYHLFSPLTPQAYYDPTDPASLTGELLFRGVIVGPSEEILFRAFPITVLLPFWNQKGDIFGHPISSAGVIAAILFTLAHIGYYLFPLEVYHFQPLQLFTALGLGLLYAIVFEQTRSILFPILIHAISDTIPVLSLFLLNL